MEIKFNICDKVVYFNPSECKIMTTEVKGIRVIPTGISKDDKGNNKLEGSVVLYETFDGPVLSEQECFKTEAECKAWYLEYFERGGHVAKAEK